MEAKNKLFKYTLQRQCMSSNRLNNDEKKAEEKVWEFTRLVSFRNLNDSRVLTDSVETPLLGLIQNFTIFLFKIFC